MKCNSFMIPVRAVCSHRETKGWWLMGSKCL